MQTGRIDGAIVQGFGYALIAELEVHNGPIQNANLGDYKLMGSDQHMAIRPLLRCSQEAREMMP